jgi:Pvc16 N-terminal domain
LFQIFHTARRRADMVRPVLVVDVPLNTTLADLDEALRVLLKRELERHGFEGVEIAFDAPSREWSGKLTGPTVNLFLYDLREATSGATHSADERRANGKAEITSPPLKLEATYAITAWTKAVEDEHRLLSQVLAIVHTHRQVPEDLLEGRLSAAGEIDTVVGRPMEEKAEFWSAVGGQYKPSIDFAVRIGIASGATFERGPEVRTQRLLTHMRQAPRGTLTEMYRFGGTVRDAAGEPVRDAWITLPELGAWTSSKSDGRFIFDRVGPGTHHLIARTADGREVETTIQVPGTTADVVLDGPKRSGGGRSRKGDG